MPFSLPGVLPPFTHSTFHWINFYSSIRFHFYCHDLMETSCFVQCYMLSQIPGFFFLCRICWSLQLSVKLFAYYIASSLHCRMYRERDHFCSAGHCTNCSIFYFGFWLMQKKKELILVYHKSSYTYKFVKHELVRECTKITLPNKARRYLIQIAFSLEFHWK